MTIDRSYFIMDREYDEKRDFIRLKIESRINIKTKNKLDVVYGVCKNLSANGIQFESNEIFSKGDILEIALDSSHVKFDNLKAKIEIVRVERADKKGQFLIAAKIIEMLT